MVRIEGHERGKTRSEGSPQASGRAYDLDGDGGGEELYGNTCAACSMSGHTIRPHLSRGSGEPRAPSVPRIASERDALASTISTGARAIFRVWICVIVKKHKYEMVVAHRRKHLIDSAKIIQE
jgi:hypothetical protein